ncbi:rho guanine nucleotide exchange factor 28 [Pholidichthys leucotaenia]
MEVNPAEVPLYGQEEVSIRFQARLPEDAEFYVALQGSTSGHVITAKRGNDGATLYFTVPGHDIAEAVSVMPYSCVSDRVEPCGGEASLKYLRDAAQEVAEFLNTNGDRLDPESYREVQWRFDRWTADEEPDGGRSDEGDLAQLDEKITRALANMDRNQQWEKSDVQPRDGGKCESELHPPKETLLHVAVRLGLVQLACFLAHRPRGQRVLTSPNQEGETPLQLAQKGGQHAMFVVLADRPGHTATPPGLWSLWSDGSCTLMFCPRSDSITLTVRPNLCLASRDSVVALREKLRDHSIQNLLSRLRADADGRDGRHTHEGGVGELHVDERVPLDDVFEERLVLSLDEDDDEEEETPSLLSVNKRPPQSSDVQNQFTPRVPDPLLSIISDSSSGDHTHGQLTQADDIDVKYGISGVTRASTGTDGGLWDSEDLLLATDTPPPLPEDPSSTPRSLLLSPVDLALNRLHRPLSSGWNSQRGKNSPPMDTCDLSLVALEVESEEENGEPKPPLTLLSSHVEKTEDRREAPRPSPDLTCTRSQSVSAYEAASLELGDQGVRLRSYSYSSPKMSFRPARVVRDGQTVDVSPDAALHSVSHGRSLLQALSLSKSLSLLHPGKQRASSISEQSHEKREISFRKRAQSADDEGSVELAESLQHLTLSEFLKEIEEEELDKYHIPTKTESEKYKVIRTFSFLKSRMSSTRTKSKGKGKDREAKDRQLNGHRFGTGSCLGPTVCVVCAKPTSGKDLLHCSGCTAIVHKGCKESVPPCLKKPQDKYAVTMVKSRTASLPQNFTVRDGRPQSTAGPISTSLPVMTPQESRDGVPQSSPLSLSFPNSESLLSESSETELDTFQLSSPSEDLLPTPVSSTSTDSSFGEDFVDSCVRSNLPSDSVDYEAESWSLTVEHKFSKRQEKRVIKRQDVIYELMQTELHHLQTLHVMAEVFRRGMREEVQLNTDAVERVFPCLDRLLLLHHAFFTAMKERRHDSGQPQGHQNYLIHRIGDILLQQFSDENGEKMKQVYGEFCSRHSEAVSVFKELQQHNKRFQSFIRQQGNNSLVRRREIPECILLVTQRIMKYPALLERILQYTQEETEEHGDISKALARVREVIAAVDLRVSEYERHQRLQEVWNRMESRSSAKLKNGLAFRKQDMIGPGKALKHQGLLLWKTATGRLKDVLALLLTDTLIFLQEKDQKYTFATVDQKPPVIALQKLIVREVANEEKGMFLISASAAGPEMYEVHTSSKEERNAWMRLIRDAVESCPAEEDESTSESEEEKRAAEARFHKIQKFQESLLSHDLQVCSSLEEKLQIYAELSLLLCGRTEAPPAEQRLLVRPQSEEPLQAAALLAAALQEAENLKSTLSSDTRSPLRNSPNSDMDSAFPVLSEPTSDSLNTPSDPGESGEPTWSEAFTPRSPCDVNDSDSKVARRVQHLTQLLYSLQAAVTIQDSWYEVQRLLLQENGRSLPRARHLPSARGHALQEQEKQRHLEKQKEEAAAARRLRDRLHREKERWERECQEKESQQGERESGLEERERRCQLAAERLRREREELEEQLEEYQQSLERLRDGQRSVERQRERLDQQQRLLQTLRDGQRSGSHMVTPHMVTPHMVILLDGPEDPALRRPGDHTGNGSVFVNEAASINNRHGHHRANDASAHNCLNTLLARSASRRPPVVKTTGAGLPYVPAQSLQLQHTASDGSCNGETWTSTASGADPQLDLRVVSMETESGGEEEGQEETIVYL